MVRPHLKVFGLSKDDSTGHSARKKEVKKRGGKTILRSGQGWTLLAPLGQLKTGLGEKILLNCHLWFTNDLAKLLDRL